MSVDKRIDYVELPAADLDAAEAFYAAVFGWSFRSFGDDYRAFTDGELNGGFFRAALSSRTNNGAALVVLYARDLEALQDAVVANGGRVCRQTFPFPGGRRFHFLDPNGNELGIWTDRPAP